MLGGRCLVWILRYLLFVYFIFFILDAFKRTSETSFGKLWQNLWISTWNGVFLHRYIFMHVYIIFDILVVMLPNQYDSKEILDRLSKVVQWSFVFNLRIELVKFYAAQKLLILVVFWLFSSWVKPYRSFSKASRELTDLRWLRLAASYFLAFVLFFKSE